MPKPSNLVFILAESHSQNLLGSAGSQFMKTPNLDRLAMNGTRFSDTYCGSPICVPSRATLATGQYPHQHRYWDNSIPFEGKSDSWMKRVRDSGHHIDAIGKLHFRSSDDDNGFSNEIETMHVAEGMGELIGLLRSLDEEPVRDGLWNLYVNRTGVGDQTHYQDYDRLITKRAVDWLNNNTKKSNKPWVLCIHYVSAHPPFVVPQRLYDLYPLEEIPTPVQFSPEDRPNHPAIQHLRHILGHAETLDEQTMKKITACYFALISHLDEQVGVLLSALDSNGITEKTRVIYTADHGYNYGNQYILGLFNLYQRSVSVPMIMAGPDVPANRVVSQITSHVDLYPTILESLGIISEDKQNKLSGCSLWPAILGSEEKRLGFSEYHAAGSRAGAFMVREDNLKLIYHVGMPSQLFDIVNDPEETTDLAHDTSTVSRLEQKLREIVDPEFADQTAKFDQAQKVASYGGKEAVLKLRQGFSYSPPPGVDWRTA